MGGVSQSILIKNIKGLAGISEPGVSVKKGRDMDVFNVLADAWLLIENGLISRYGTMDTVPETVSKVIDAAGKFVFPCYVDSHTHLVFARSREDEFVMRIRGESYEEIAKKGGGILNSASRLQQMTEEELFELASHRLRKLILQGTGAIEIKSGYGLTVNDELKMLRVIKKLKSHFPVVIKATFLGAHAYPTEYKTDHGKYLQLIIDQMLPQIADEGLADYCDAFCEKGFFSPEETTRVLEAAWKYGLKPKIHGNQLGHTGGVQVAVSNHAVSIDHLEFTSDEEIECLVQSATMPVALPNCSFFLGLPYAPARKMIDAGLPLCLASDYNPGTAPGGRMGFVVSLACTQMRLTPAEAFNAVTLNGAAALELSDQCGSIAKGKLGNVFITSRIPSPAYIPYNFAEDVIETVILNGEIYR
jgi:imidazolonepropionase